MPFAAEKLKVHRVLIKLFFNSSLMERLFKVRFGNGTTRFYYFFIDYKGCPYNGLVREPLQKGKAYTIDLLVLTSLDKLLWKIPTLLFIIFLLSKIAL
jgi:hypothetical protein